MAKRKTSRPRDREAELEALYAQIPPMIGCTGACADSCGPITMTPLEAARSGHPNDMASMTCPKLDFAGRCSVYEKRPLICRLWGTARSLACHHGCLPAWELSDAKLGELVERVEALGGRSPVVSLEPVNLHITNRAVELMMKGDL